MLTKGKGTEFNIRDGKKWSLYDAFYEEIINELRNGTKIIDIYKQIEPRLQLPLSYNSLSRYIRRRKLREILE